MGRARGYRILCGGLGLAFVFAGLTLVGIFFSYQQPHVAPPIPTGPVGHYFVAFSGCALIGWGGGLLAAVREPEATRLIGTITAFVLVLMAFVRILAWAVGDYYLWLGDASRVEAVLFLALALGFVWLRPSATAAESVGA